MIKSVINVMYCNHRMSVTVIGVPQQYVGSHAGLLKASSRRPRFVSSVDPSLALQLL